MRADSVSTPLRTKSTRASLHHPHSEESLPQEEPSWSSQDPKRLLSWDTASGDRTRRWSSAGIRTYVGARVGKPAVNTSSLPSFITRVVESREDRGQHGEREHLIDVVDAKD